jgi:hypothetical protein
MASRKTLTKTKDVLQNVSTKLNVDYEAVELVYKIMMDYVLKNSKKTEIVSMRFPNLGVMYVKRGYLLSKMERIENGKYAKRDSGRRTVAMLKKKIDYINKLVAERGFLFNLKRPIFIGYEINKKSTLQEREEKQNEYFYEGKD